MGRADVHDGVGPVAGPVGIDRCVGDRLEPDRADRRCLAARQGAPEDPPDVRVHRAHPHTERDRGDRPGGVRPDARQALQGGDVARDPALVVFDDGPRRAAQVQRPAVVAHPLPCPEDVGRARFGERLDGRKALEEPGPRVDDPGDLGLLGHHLRDEDGVGIAGTSEGERAATLVEPGKDGGARIG